MAHDVFISYAAEDAAVAEKVCRALEGEGIRCWMAPRDVPYGADYEEAIVDAIAESRFLVLIFSAHSNTSQHVEREIRKAFEECSATRVFPFRIENVTYNKVLYYYLGGAQWQDAPTPPLEAHLRRLIQHIRAHLPTRPPVPPPPGPPRPAPIIKETEEDPRPFPLERLALGLGALLLLSIVAGIAYHLSRSDGGRVNGNASGVGVSPSPGTSKPPAPTVNQQSADDRLAAAIKEKLNRYPGLRTVEVSVKGGKVRLSGEVYSLNCRWAAGKLSYVEGVSVVDNFTMVQTAPRLRSTIDVDVLCEP